MGGLSDKELITGLVLIVASMLEEKGDPLSTDTLRERLKRYDNYARIELIDRWVHSETGRTVLKRLLIDHVSGEAISEEIDRSPRQTARIIKQAKTELSGHI